jgi:hypothetical protein
MEYSNVSTAHALLHMLEELRDQMAGLVAALALRTSIEQAEQRVDQVLF